jgi:hypothetical protein
VWVFGVLRGRDNHRLFLFAGCFCFPSSPRLPSLPCLLAGYDQAGRTPLIIAVSNHNNNMVHALLDVKADVNGKELKGARNAPLHTAYDCGDNEIVKVRASSFSLSAAAAAAGGAAAVAAAAAGTSLSAGGGGGGGGGDGGTPRTHVHTHSHRRTQTMH